ncbi:hypothetical protein E2562_037213 [Oryza meyeriana var. granulata]|uniref:Uncharacterized protein n=1 Tax=Oryza meyeriana var. granulata TaxID=110450 RepID=A0A6G1E897_9ORYZ|nr:hypothetical protein E2562_037213 [Oryza meyeriana var. granulata]
MGRHLRITFFYHGCHRNRWRSAWTHGGDQCTITFPAPNLVSVLLSEPSSHVPSFPACSPDAMANGGEDATLQAWGRSGRRQK